MPFFCLLSPHFQILIENIAVYHCHHSDSLLPLRPTSRHLDAFMRKILSAFVCRGVCCEYLCYLGPMSEHTTLFVPQCVFTGEHSSSHLCLFSSSLCVYVCVCIKNKQSSSQVEGLGRIVSRVLLMIITVERECQGTAGQLPACLLALLPYCCLQLTAFFQGKHVALQIIPFPSRPPQYHDLTI